MDKLETLRHSAAHVLAQAVLKIFPDAHLAIGPPIDTGFYYDIGNITLTEEDLSKIEKEMQHIINQDLKFKKLKVSRKEAEKLLHNQPYKLEILKGLKDDDITFYQDGDFIDLCAGPHVESTGKIKAFKLLKIAGAYWRGDSNKPMLTRIYGTAFSGKDELNDFLKMQEEAELRDHIKLGRELDLFSLSEFTPGSAFLHPKGAIIWHEIEKYLHGLYQKHGYQFVITPIIMDNRVWVQSGHWDHYKDNMYFTKVNNKGYGVKPMNCPGHIFIYKQHLHSYKELPIRFAEFGIVHRLELSGVIHGLTRVRKMTQDDAHIFCTDEQIENEILNLLHLIKKIYNVFGFYDYTVKLSTRPDNSMGDSKLWEKAEKSLENALKKSKLKYEIAKEEGAFYGPKIDFDVKDALNRPWQLATIQLDFQMPERFELTYEGQDGKKHTPVIIHRAIIGSFDRFLGVLIEHTAGKFPLWLSPVQVRLLTITSDNFKFAEEILEKLKDTDIRAELDDRSETIARKVRDAQLAKVNYIVTIGDKEQEKKTLAIRTLDGKVKFGVKVDDFLEELVEKIEKKDAK